jgi:hypothetical protein
MNIRHRGGSSNARCHRKPSHSAGSKIQKAIEDRGQFRGKEAGLAARTLAPISTCDLQANCAIVPQAPRADPARCRSRAIARGSQAVSLLICGPTGFTQQALRFKSRKVLSGQAMRLRRSTWRATALVFQREESYVRLYTLLNDGEPMLTVNADSSREAQNVAVADHCRTGGRCSR